MSKQTDPRVAELEALAREERIRLPYPPDLIVYFERMGKVVDLISGEVYDTVTVATTRNTQALCHLLS